MTTPIYARIKKPIIIEGEIQFSDEDYIFTNTQDLFDEVTENHAEITKLIVFAVHGSNYQSRKASLRDLAMRFYDAIAEDEPRLELSCGEWAIVTDYFCDMGKRYGLLKEFQENAIC